MEDDVEYADPTDDLWLARQPQVVGKTVDDFPQHMMLVHSNQDPIANVDAFNILSSLQRSQYLYKINKFKK